MVRFAEWIALESFMDEVERDVFLEYVVTDSLDAIFGYLERGLLNERDEDEDEDEDEEPAELDDPFTGGDDAEPVEIDRDYVPDEAYDEKRELGRILKALRVLRNDAKRERAEIVEKVKEFKKELDVADIDDTDSRRPLDILDRDYLFKLGYLSERRAAKIRDAMTQTENKKKRLGAQGELMRKIEAAASETGNEHEPSSAAVANRAMGEMFEAMSKVYGRRFSNLAWRNQSRVGQDQVGHQTYEADELASETMMKLLARFQKRQWDDGQLMPWEENDGLLKSGDLDHLKNFIFLTIRNLGSTMRRKKNAVGNPASRMKLKDQVASQDEKARRIKNDLKSGELSYYEDYMNAAKDNPLQDREGGGPPIEFSVPSNSKDRVRLAIMRDIEYMVTWTPSSREEMSMDERLVRRTLEAYKSKFLRRGEGSVTYASTLGGKDDDSSVDDLLSGADARGVAPENPLSSGAAATGQVSSFNAKMEIFNFLKPYMVRAINMISAENSPEEAYALCIKFDIPCEVTIKKVRNNNFPGKVVAEFPEAQDLSPHIRTYIQKAIEQRKREGWWSWTTFCKDAFGGYGKNNIQISREWTTYPKELWNTDGTRSKEKLSPRSHSSMNAYLAGVERDGRLGGLARLCDKMKQVMPRWFTQ